MLARLHAENCPAPRSTGVPKESGAEADSVKGIVVRSCKTAYLAALFIVSSQSVFQKRTDLLI